MNVIVPPDTNMDGLNAKLKSVGLGFMVRHGEILLVYRHKYPAVFPDAQAFAETVDELLNTLETQDLSP